MNRAEEESEEEKIEEVEGGLGFDDPFFQHDVAMATTVSGISCHLNVLSLLLSHTITNSKALPSALMGEPQDKVAVGVW